MLVSRFGGSDQGWPLLDGGHHPISPLTDLRPLDRGDLLE